MKKLFLTLLIATGITATAQVKIGNRPTQLTSPESTTLELESATGALLITRIANVGLVTNPVNGMFVYDLSSNCFKGFQNGTWSGCGFQPGSPSANGTAAVLSYSSAGCTVNVINGTMKVGTAVSGVTMDLYADVTTAGTYSINTPVVNGVSFLGSGTLAAGACQKITLTATGTPVAEGVFNYVSNTTPSATVNGLVGCGAFIAPGVLKRFQCHNLGADTTLDPNVPAAGLHGNYYQWGIKDPVGNAAGLIGTWNTTPAADGAWLDASKTANDPCPNDFRVPTNDQWAAVIANNTKNYQGTFANDGNFISAITFGTSADAATLTLPAAGYRNTTDGPLYTRGNNGYYWSSTEYGAGANYLYFYSGLVSTTSNNRPFGLSVRCVSE